MTASEDEPTISIPTIVLLCLLSFLALRYYLSARDSLAAASGRGGLHGRRVNPEQVEQIAQMFPQMSRRDIMWDLQRNGGSVTSTTERILGGGGLDVPPPSFQPVLPPPVTTSSAPSAPKPQEPDLITRYNLASKISGPDELSANAEAEAARKQKQGWSQNKNERQELLKRRRDEMILNARRKMMERDGKGN